MPAAAKTKHDEEQFTGPSDFRIGFLVHDVSRLRKTLFDQEIEHLGITRAQWWALAQLSREGRSEGILQVELAEILDVGKGAIGGLISRLEVGGFVVRTVDKSDRRAQRVRITKHGHKVLEQMSSVGRKLNARIFANISAKDIEATERVLVVMKRNIKQMVAQPTANGRQRNK